MWHAWNRIRMATWYCQVQLKADLERHRLGCECNIKTDLKIKWQDVEDQVTGCLKQGNELSVFMKCEKFLDHTNNYYLS